MPLFLLAGCRLVVALVFPFFGVIALLLMPLIALPDLCYQGGQFRD
jgi:hypothetical protein